MVKLRTRRDLRFYQRWLADTIVREDAVLLTVPMGMGKTASTLTAIRDLLDSFRVRHVLVVGPLEVARSTWPDEIEAWKHTRVLSYAVAVGAEEQRIAAVNEMAEVTIINRENIRWLVEYWGDDWPYDMLVYDEASRLKAGKKRTEGGKPKVDEKTGIVVKPKPRLSEFGALCRVRKHFSKVVELTGTPAPNGMIDLWGPIYLLDGGERLGKTKRDFERRWFVSDFMGWSLTPRKNADQQIMSAVKDVMIGLKAEDYIELPKTVSNVVKVHLSDKHMKEYRKFERTLVADAYDVEAVTKGVLTNKLLQFANGSLYRIVDDSTPPRKEIIAVHDRKLDALESIIEEAQGESVLLAYSFKFDLQRIKKKYPKAVVFDDDPDFVKNWNAGKIRLGLAHPASIGHGLNLQHGGHIQVWYGMTWSLELYQQFNARLARPGQQNTVFIHHILAEDTADEVVYRSMNQKDATQKSVTEAVRVLIADSY